jgi:tRNA threonylcarbamoyladenosine biosynthesis protein TsaB
MEAGRNEVFAGEYGPEAARERLLSRNEALSADRTRTLVTPDKPLAEWLRASGRDVEEVAPPGSADIARLGWKKLQAGQGISPQDLDANYIRRSDAEIFSGRHS